MDNQTKKIFTIPQLMERWNLNACDVLKSIYTDRKNIYLYLQGETICTGTYPAGELEFRVDGLLELRRWRPELERSPSQYTCEHYEELQLIQLKHMLSSFKDDVDFIEVKKLEEISFGGRGKIIYYRSLLNPVRLPLSKIFCFAEGVSFHELSNNIPIIIHNSPINFKNSEASNSFTLPNQRQDIRTKNNEQIQANEEEIHEGEVDLIYLNNPKDRDFLLNEEAKKIITGNHTIKKSKLIEELMTFCAEKKIVIGEERLSRIIHPRNIKVALGLQTNRT